MPGNSNVAQFPQQQNEDDYSDRQILRLASASVFFNVETYLENDKGYDKFTPKFNLVLHNFERHEQVYCMVEADRLYMLADYILKDRVLDVLAMERNGAWSVFTGGDHKEGGIQSRVFSLKHDPEKNNPFVFGIRNGPGRRDDKGRVMPLKSNNVQFQGQQNRGTQNSNIPDMSVVMYLNEFDLKRFAKSVVTAYDNHLLTKSVADAIHPFLKANHDHLMNALVKIFNELRGRKVTQAN